MYGNGYNHSGSHVAPYKLDECSTFWKKNCCEGNDCVNVIVGRASDSIR